MSARDLIVRLIQHHLWAQERVLRGLEAMEVAPAEALRLFNHIHAADRTWLTRLEGSDTTTALWSEEAALAGLRRELENLKPAWQAVIDTLTEARLEQVLTYGNAQGVIFSNNIADILTHVTNHASYHRAQVARIIREAGGEPVNTGFIGFAREGH